MVDQEPISKRKSTASAQEVTCLAQKSDSTSQPVAVASELPSLVRLPSMPRLPSIPPQSPPNLIFRQLFDQKSSTYTYILQCANTREQIIIDPVLDTVERDIELIQGLQLNLKFQLNTHVHQDHVTATGQLKAHFNGPKKPVWQTSELKSGIGNQYDPAPAQDFYVEPGLENQHVFGIGSEDTRFSLEGVHTPGHTAGCFTYVFRVGNQILYQFTGDALLIGGCGRTDFQGGSSEVLYKTNKGAGYDGKGGLLSYDGKEGRLPDHCVLYPGHDYKGRTCTTVWEERKYNARLKDGVSKEEFCKIMANLQLAYPKQIDKQLPQNMKCGL